MPASSSALFTITLDPFCKPWKKLRGVLAEAQRRGMEIVVALDDRTCVDCFRTFFELGIAVTTFRSHGMTENGYRVVQQVQSDFALMVADDEIPSTPLWDFAMRPTSPSRFGVVVIPVLGERLMSGHIGWQERLVWVDGWRFVPRVLENGKRTMFEGTVRSDAPMIVLLDQTPEGVLFNPGVMIWHYLLEAPREEREAKAARYAEFDPYGNHKARLFYEDQPNVLIDLPENIRRYLPQEV